MSKSKPSNSLELLHAAKRDYSRAIEGFDAVARRLKENRPFTPSAVVWPPDFCPEAEQMAHLKYSGRRDADSVLVDQHLRTCRAHWYVYAKYLELLQLQLNYIKRIEALNRDVNSSYARIDEERTAALMNDGGG